MSDQGCTADNIANDAKIEQNMLQLETDVPKMYNIHQVCELISEHYERGFKHLRFSPPMQITDGSAAEFIDDDFKITVATCRIRLLNKLHINTNTGDMLLGVALSDIVFQRSSLGLTVNM